jgi:transcriptional regulator with XRE-family HTH domain
MMKTGELLALCREMKGLSLRDVEMLTGVSNPTISQAENGHHGLKFVTAVKLCDAYGISLERLAATIRAGKRNRSKGGESK